MAVYIVEDDRSVADALRLLVQHLGHETLAYPDAESFMREQPPGGGDIVIVDLLLPGLSGAGVIRWLQSLPDPPRVIAMTGQTQQAFEKQIHGLALETLWRKPLTQELITAAL